MYFFIEKSRAFAVRSEQFGIDYQDVYIAAMQAMQEEYSLPSLHEWGDGYVQGDAKIQDIVELVSTINKIENADEPVVYVEEDDEDYNIIHTDVYVYLDKKLIEKIETQIESQILTFGEDEYSSSQFDSYKEKAEEVIKKLLEEEYYQSGDTIGHDYSVFFLADEMRAFEHIEASSNWSFQQENEARFQILHLNNYDKAFKDYTYLIAEESYSTVRDNLDCSDEQVLAQMIEMDIDVENENIKEPYNNLDYDQRLELWDIIAEEGAEKHNEMARSEAISSIIEEIDWEEIENWFNDQFVKEEEEA